VRRTALANASRSDWQTPTPSTKAPRCQRCRQRSATPTLRRRAAICTRVLTARAVWSSIAECFFNEDENW